jgi:hypothetical protein
MGIARRARHHEVYWAAEEDSQSFLELEVSRQPRTKFIAGRIVDDEVDIGAFGIEGVGGGRTEDFQARDAKRSAKVLNHRSMLFDKWMNPHGCHLAQTSFA